MKLSMWMIANRLSSLLDLETEISLEAKPILNSARLVYATNCVHIYQDKATVICEGEGDRIRIHGVSIKEAFEIIQGVFDFFQDWESRIQEDIRQRNFQALIDHCDILFQNPLLLMNANYFCLGKSSGYGPEDVDEEWAYISRYHYSSLASIRQMRHDLSVDLERSGYSAYHYSTIPGLKYGGVSYNLQFNALSCGRLTVLAYNRPLNPGDYQLIVKLAGYLEPVLGTENPSGTTGASALYHLILGKPYVEHELQLQFAYHHWSETDTFQIAVLLPTESRPANPDMPLLMRTLQQQFPYTVVFLKENQIIIMSNRDFSKDPHFLEYYLQYVAPEGIRLGFSLPSGDYSQAASLYRQALHAITYSQRNLPSEDICYFSSSAVYYILETPYPAERLQACHPQIRYLWREKQRHQDPLYDTLKAYLDYERSPVKTAEALFTHRNTVLYRLKKCMSLLNDDLEQPAIRYYLRLSMLCIESVADIFPSS